MTRYLTALCASLLLSAAARAGTPGPTPIWTTLGHSRVIYAVAISPDGKRLASASVDNTIKLWDTSDGTLLRTIGGTVYSNGLSFFPDGRRLASADGDGALRVWDTETGAVDAKMGGRGDPALAVAVFPDGERLVSGGADGKVRFWRAGARKPYRTVSAHPGYATTVAVSPDGALAASGSASSPVIKVWDARKGAAAGKFEGHSEAVNSLAFSPSGERLASAGEDGTIKVWGLSGGLCLQTYAPGKPVYAVAYAPDGSHIFSGGADRTVSVWNAAKEGRPAAAMTGHAGAVKALAVSADGKYLASGGLDRTLKFWLTPWEAAARKAAAEIAEESARNYERHYAAGVQLMASPTRGNLKLAKQEFSRALSYRETPDCREKLGEASQALVEAERRLLRQAMTALKALLPVVALLLLWKLASRLNGKARARKNLPGEIKRQTLSGNYDRALDLYREFRAIGGDPANLHAAELRELYHSLRIMDELPKEDLPARFLLDYAAAYAKDGNYRLAAAMLRSGRLADDLSKPEEYDSFAAVYRLAGGVESLLAVRLKPGTYSGLAEAFARAGDHAGCLKACALKEQFYPGGLSPRDSELLAAARVNAQA